MTFFLDANVLIYTTAEGRRADACRQILRAVADGEADGRTSTATLEEVWHIERSGRAGPIEGLTERTYTLLAPLLPVTDGAFRRALALEVPSVGTNDRLHAATCFEHGIEAIVTADADFNSLSGIRRVDPLDRPAVRELLSS